jgi:glycoprotein endo-alpha-1,2-mannosidase
MSQLVLLIFSCTSVFSQTGSFFHFIEEQSGRRYSRVPREVLAAYYGWYGPGQGGWLPEINTNAHTIGNTARYPIKGPYSSHDVDVIDWQIDQAKAHGITGFIVSWFGTGPEGAWINESLIRVLDRAANKDFKVAVYWEQAPGDGQEQINRAVGELGHVVRSYGKKSSFLKVNGKPVVFVYGRVQAQVPLTAWPEIIRRTREEAGDFLLVADGFLESLACVFDGVHTYGGPSENDLEKKRVLYARMYADEVWMARKHNRISCVTVGAGYDDRKQNKPGSLADRHDGKVYRILWEEALKANSDWVIISTWNEWPEGTEIEPSLEFGDKYLRLTKEFATQFVRLPAIEAPAPVPLPRLVPGGTNRVDRLLAGRTVGAISTGDFAGWDYDRRFWLAYCGAEVRHLTWTDLIDRRKFNARDVPLLLHFGNDHFRSSAKVTDDVSRALVQYHREGGFLAIVATAPWPLLYDDSRSGKPAAISDVLGTGVTGWPEAPVPPQLVLTFHARTNILFGLRTTAPFPTEGDCRFTPGTKRRVPTNDIYVPLVQLKDNTGAVQGDAVVYIEHRAAPLAPGKTVYAWMRMPEVFGTQDFLLSLYQFISTRLKPMPSDREKR